MTSEMTSAMTSEMTFDHKENKTANNVCVLDVIGRHFGRHGFGANDVGIIGGKPTVLSIWTSNSHIICKISEFEKWVYIVC